VPREQCNSFNCFYLVSNRNDVILLSQHKCRSYGVQHIVKYGILWTNAQKYRAGHINFFSWGGGV
jgi:hypothetical protein